MIASSWFGGALLPRALPAGPTVAGEGVTGAGYTWGSMRGTVDGEAARLASEQAGCLGRRQVLDVGFSDRMVARRLAKGLWVRRHPGVYAVAAVSRSWFQDVWAAVLAVGERVVVSHETALLLAEAVDDHVVPRWPIVLTVPHGRHHRIDGAVVHQIDDIRPRHVRRIAGLDVCTPARAVVDLAATARERQLRRLIDDLVADRKTTIAAIAAVLRDVTRPGKPGAAKLGRILDDLGDGYVPPQSELERLLFAALDDAGLPPPQRQVPLPGAGEIVGLVDAGYDDAKLLVEVDGRRWHSRQRNFVADRARDAQAARAGWQTLRFTYEQLVGGPAEVATIVSEVLQSRLQAVPGTAAA